MRALVVAAAPRPGSAAIVADWAALSDFVCAVDAGIHTCDEAGVAPDLLVGDFDSVDPASFEHARAADVMIESHPADKDRSDLALALDAVLARSATDIAVTCSLGLRLDHTLAALGEIARRAAYARIRLVEPSVDGWLVCPGQTWRADRAGLSTGDTVSLIALQDRTRVTALGWKWDLAAARLDVMTSVGLSNVLQAVDGSVETHEGCVLVIRDLTR